MNFNQHLELQGKHAFLAPSKYSWINWDNDKLIDSYMNSMRPELGTRLHEFSASHIKTNFKLPKSKKQVLQLIHAFMLGQRRSALYIQLFDYLPDEVFATLACYVNDAIGYKMTPEVVLKYSDICFGTTDSISFRDGYLRIHDLKTGVTPAHIEQLELYAALFCLEYHVKPQEIGTELRIYQNGEVLCHNPDAEEIQTFMDICVDSSAVLTEFIGNGGNVA